MDDLIDQTPIAPRDGRAVVGYTSGVFDLLHDGHKKYLKTCKEKCDFLIVGVDEDVLVRTNKGPNRPFQNIGMRLKQLTKERLGDIFFKKSIYFEEMVKLIGPQKYFIPNNRTLQESRLRLIAELNIELVIVNYTSGISTSLIAKNMRGNT